MYLKIPTPSFPPFPSLGLQALIIRDVWLLNIISAGFEFAEYTLETQLPNFGECWWDHVSRGTATVTADTNMRTCTHT